MAPTTIQGVSILSRQKKRGHDVFELVLSSAGVEVRRPERPVQQMSWDRVSEWEIEECKGYVLLTLRGQGATTPLVVPDWTLDDLELLMREVTGGTTTYEPDEPGSVAAVEESDGAAGAAVPSTALSAPAPAPEPAPAPPTRAERRRHAAREARQRHGVPWRVVVTVALLGVLATAVIVVLLQSAGIIDWSFLGPVA
jgi:hypothetical protein